MQCLWKMCEEIQCNYHCTHPKHKCHARPQVTANFLDRSALHCDEYRQQRKKSKDTAGHQESKGFIIHLAMSNPAEAKVKEVQCSQYQGYGRTMFCPNVLADQPSQPHEKDDQYRNESGDKGDRQDDWRGVHPVHKDGDQSQENQEKTRPTPSPWLLRGSTITLGSNTTLIGDILPWRLNNFA
eukprot:TRINITY_DN67154_c0_g1_i1.p2 TRINITY_DN67154_c0_g1~~TRINITY_DN67154_c0_g1_i1.p2  ORF type:complete len:183 (-),score=21.89 TRINITY_DN67154_c0_g1_i1:250-798(-)